MRSDFNEIEFPRFTHFFVFNEEAWIRKQKKQKCHQMSCILTVFIFCSHRPEFLKDHQNIYGGQTLRIVPSCCQKLRVTESRLP